MSWRARLRRWLVAIGLILALIVGAAVVLLRVKFEGEELGVNIADLLNKKMRGHIEIASIEWPARSLPTLATGGWVPLTLRGVKVYDGGTPAKKLIDVPEIDAEIDIHTLFFKGGFVFRNVVVKGGSLLIEQIDEPYPLHHYDRSVISLFDAFSAPHVAGFSTGTYVSSASIFDLRSFAFDHVHVDLHMGNYVAKTGQPAFSFTASLNDVSGRGFLYDDASDPLVPRLYFALAGDGARPGLAAGPGSVVHLWEVAGVPSYTIPLRYLRVDRVAQLPDQWPGDAIANSLALDLTAITDEGAIVRLGGGIKDYWDRPFDGTWELDGVGLNLGATVADVFTKHLGGRAMQGTFKLRGPYVSLPKVSFALSGVELSLPLPGDAPLTLALDDLEGEMDNVNEQLKLERTVARGAGGEVELAGTVQLAGELRVDGNLFVTRPLELAPWLPATVRDAIGSKLSGSLHATGDLAKVLRFDDLTGLALGGVRFDRRGVITAQDYFHQIALTNVAVSDGGTGAQIDGTIDALEDTLDLAVAAESADLDAWLRRFHLPPAARTGGGAVRIRGSFAQPRVVGRVHAGGVAVVDQVQAGVVFAGHDLAISDVSSGGLGGSLTGGGHVTVGGTTVVKDFHLSGRDLDAARLPGAGGVASGKIARAEVSVSGPTSRLHIEGELATDDLTVAGDRYQHVAMCINDDPRHRRPGTCEAAVPRTPPPADAREAELRAEVDAACAAARERGGLCLTGRADRAAPGGGTVDVTAVRDAGGALHSAVDVAGLPLSTMLGAHAGAGGAVTTRLFVGGTAGALTAEGTIQLLRGWLGGGFLGDADVRVAPAGPGQVAFTGTLLQGRVALRAVVGTAAPFPATITADVRRLDVDPYVDLGAYVPGDDPVHVWTSGQIQVHTELGSAHPPIDAVVALSELSATVDQRDADGRPAPLTITASSPVRLRYHDGAVELACVDPQPGAAPHVTPCPVTLATPAGTMTISGYATPAKLAVAATGRLDASLLRTLFADYVEESGGSADLDVQIGGTLARPLVNATLAMNDVWFRPLRQDTVIHLLEGTVGLKDNDDLGFTGMKLTVKDNYSGDFTELDLGGGVKLADWKPAHWGITLDGDLPAKLLLAVAPAAFSQASGVADVEVWLQGYGVQPAIDGRLTFDPKRPFTLVPRGVHRELVMSDGFVNLVDEVAGAASGDPCHPPRGAPDARVGSLRRYQIDLCDVGGSIDEEGQLHGIRGTLELEDWALAGGDVTLHAQNLPFRVPHQLELTLDADPIRVAYDQITHAWNLTGQVAVVSGAYVRNFDVSTFRPQDTGDSGGDAKPFWEEYPVIGATNLDVSLDVRKFSVNDNLASNVDMSGQLGISGTPRDPRLDGTIQVSRGEFRLPGSRAKFTSTTGSVTFSRLSRFPSDTPTLAIQSEANYTDPSGQNHLITLLVDGTLSHITWDLFTSSGLNKGQTMTLIFSGRTPEQFRRQLGNDAVATDPTHIDPTTNPNDSYADQLVKDVAADFISLLVEDSLKDVTQLDVARLEIGTTGSFGFHGEKKLTETINLLGDLEQTVRGSTIYVRGEWHAPYKFILQAGYLKKNFDDASQEDVSDPEFKLVYRFFIP